MVPMESSLQTEQQAAAASRDLSLVECTLWSQEEIVDTEGDITGVSGKSMRSLGRLPARLCPGQLGPAECRGG